MQSSSVLRVFRNVMLIANEAFDGWCRNVTLGTSRFSTKAYFAKTTPFLLWLPMGQLKAWIMTVLTTSMGYGWIYGVQLKIKRSWRILGSDWSKRSYLHSLITTLRLWVSESHSNSGISSHGPWPPHMEGSRKAVIAGDTCHEGVIYMPVLQQAMAPHSLLSLSEP